MCTHGACSSDCDYSLPSNGLRSAPILYADAESRDSTNYHYTYSTHHPPFTSSDAASSLASVRYSAADQAFESAENPVNIRQPPQHAVDYLYGWPGFSLDPPPSENAPNPTNFPFRFPPTDRINDSASGTTTLEKSSLEDPIASEFKFKETSSTHPSPPYQAERRRAQPHGVVRHQPRGVRAQKRATQRAYDQPGKKPAAEYVADPRKLRALCQLRGGTDFACQWIPVVFKDGVDLGALVRRLTLAEIEGWNFPGGFEPCLAYDGFLQKAEDDFECCLCMVGKRVWWKNKKDAIRHFRKFHFGLADRCDTCHKHFYSTGEMNSHRCVHRQNLIPPATTTEPEAIDNGSLNSTSKSGSGVRSKATRR